MFNRQQYSDSYEDFMRFIAREYSSQTKIYGIEKHEFSKYLKARNNQTLISSSVVVPRPFSMVKIEVITSGGHSQFHLFVAKNSKHEYKVGRAQNCDIIISQNTISREQCRFIYEQDELNHYQFSWFIRDGSESKESSNGTWVCLTDYRLRSFKQESPLEIL